MSAAKLTSKQRHELKRFIKELEQHKGRHTELVTVYIPVGYDINKIIQQLQQEQGTATNIKSASTRKNVIDALERMVQHLRLFKRTPENGLAVFSGNVAPEGRQDFKVWSLEPPIPVQMKIYRCDKAFLLDLLRDMLDVKEIYGLVLIDRREGVIASLKGKATTTLSKHTSNVPGKMRAGGQCLAPDSIVQVSDGNLIPIGSVNLQQQVKSATLQDIFGISDSSIVDKWNIKSGTVYEITTKNPVMSVRASENHVFYVATSIGIVEKQARELTVGDYLLTPEKIEIKGVVQKINSKKYYNSFSINEEGRKVLQSKRSEKGLYQRQLSAKIGATQTLVSIMELGKQHADREYLRLACEELGINFEEFLNNYAEPYLSSHVKLPTEIDEPFAQFIGYFIGDGSIEPDRMTFSEQDQSTAFAYKAKFDDYFQLESSYKFRAEKNYHQLRLTSRPLVRLIAAEFPEIKKALNSAIPEKILKSPDNVVAAFLRGFYDAEGYATSRGVGLGINNAHLARQIQLALRRFSVIASVHKYDNRRNPYSRKPRHTIDITEKLSLQHFKKHISFTSFAKLRKLENLISTRSDTSYVRRVATSGRKVRNVIEAAGYNITHFTKVSNFFRNGRMMSKQTFRESILKSVENERLRKQLQPICDCPLLPAKIKKIEKEEGEFELIDISVQNQNFIANGLLVHNSAARFGRIRENAAKEFYQRMGEHIKEAFFGNKELKGIIVGGPGPTKHEFIEGDYIPTELKQKIIAVKDITYTDEFGLHELLDASQDVLAKEELSEEKKLMGKFFDCISKNERMAGYGHDDVMKKLRMGAVDVLLISESLSDDTIAEFEEEAEKFGTQVQIISTETREGIQLKEFGGVAALLRYEVHE